MGAIVVYYVGLAGAMRDFAVDWACNRVRYPNPRPVSHEPGTQAAVARMDADLAAARTLLYSVAEEYDSSEGWPLDQMLSRGTQVKSVASRTCCESRRMRCT
jgi:alkylation response protein AidB-like acyl-CoA dehydrogenase